MEHRRQRHIDIIGSKASDGVIAAGNHSHAQRMQNQLTVGKMHPFGVAGGTGGVKRCSLGVFVEIRKCVIR